MRARGKCQRSLELKSNVEPGTTLLRLLFTLHPDVSVLHNRDLLNNEGSATWQPYTYMAS